MIDRIQKRTDVILIYFLIFSFGLIKVSYYLTCKFVSKLDFSAIINQLCDWSDYFPHNKYPQLLFYVLTLVSLFFYYFSFVVLEKQQNFTETLNPRYIYTILFLAIIYNFLFLEYGQLTFSSILFFGVIFLTGLSFFLKKSEFNYEFFSKKNSIWSSNITLLLILILYLQIFFIFLPLFSKSMLVQNDYMDIPEKTILSHQIVDNNKYIKQHLSLNIVKYDPRTDYGNNPEGVKKVEANLDDNLLAKLFIKSNFRRKFFYEYDDTKKKLYLYHRNMYLDEYKELIEIFDKKTKASLSIHELFYKSQDLPKKTKNYSYEEREFLKYNKLELSNQAKAGWFLFHHSWILNPINAISLGAPWNKQVLIYGFLSSITIQKILNFSGGITYQSYFKFMYFLYPLYFLLFLIGIYAIFKRFYYVLIAGLLLGISYLALSYQLILLAPGFNPIRHFWDIWAFVFLNVYLIENKKFYLYVSLLIGLFSIVWSKDFGIAVYFAILGGYFSEVFYENKLKNLEVIKIFLLFCLGLLIYGLPIYGVNYNFSYMLLGISLPSISNNYIGFILILISTFFILYIKFLKKNEARWFLSFSFFIYSQILLIYFIWNPGIHHVMSASSGLILFILSLFDISIQKVNFFKKYKNFIIKYIILTLIIFYSCTFGIFLLGKNQIQNIFKNHVLFHWNFDKAKFDSTMEPDLFENSVKLINKYSRANGIYLISKYDAVLPMLANKYNEIPAVSVALDMIGKKDIYRMSSAIDHNHPKYLFVDTDIMRNYISDIYSLNGPLSAQDYDESLGRATVLNNMKNLFKKVQDKYELVEKGQLISVYRFKSLTINNLNS